MSPEVQIALIVSVPPTLAACGALVMAWWTDRRANKKADVAAVKSDLIIHLTDGTLSAATKRIDQLEELVRALVAERAREALPPSLLDTNPRNKPFPDG